jgi:hypothetical protein
MSFPDGYLAQVARIEESLWPDFVAAANRLAFPAAAKA